MEEWKERLFEEHKQLKEKLVKLIEFMNSEKYFAFDNNTKAVFNKQRLGMEIYLNALNIRVYGDTTKYNNFNDVLPLLLMSTFNYGSAFDKSPEYYKLKDIVDNAPVKEEENNE